MNPRLLLIVILVLFAGGIWWGVDHPPKLGLDLKGGTRLTLEAEPSEQVKTITPDVMSSLHTVIENRVNKFGVSEAIVQKAGDKRLLIEIPGIKDPQEARRQLGRVGELEFRTITKEGEWESTGIGGKDLKFTRLDTLQSGEWIVSFDLNDQGTKAFGDLTTKLAKNEEPLGIFFDGELVSAPKVDNAIVKGAGYIKGSFTRDEAKEMVDILNAGALPVAVEVIEESTVGPLLGQQAINQSLTAGLIGLALVAGFMVLWYRSKGFIASVALLFYSVATYTAYLLFDVTFTLAGIAGFILSIGMAVDANILIFERTKEELALGKTPKRSVEAGFDRAFPSIFDSNMTTLITCAILWWLGTGSVKGFALTLAIGVLVSMFSAITVTKTILQIVMGDSGKARLTFSRG